MTEDSSKNSEAQARRAKHGRDYEIAMFNFVSEGLKELDNIIVLHPGTKANGVPNIQTNTHLGPFIPDIDILIVDKATKMPRVVISVKTSMRERITGSLYSFRLLRDKNPSLDCIVALEGAREYDSKTNKPKPLELGSDEKPTRPRQEAIYENVRIFVDNPEIKMGIGVRPRSELIDYIKSLVA